ncbi:MAG: type II toxin-antitoxin system VapC family toxin [Spirochaetaceae bacterium]|jgi:predicted nucleic acid-binding protein|nr:type II toxin-antitoxin system VapC family toxin [Spirochaetaceae bacterium]
MEPVLIDSNILIDIFSDNREWFQWSRDQLTLLSQQTQLFINPIIYTEISIGFEKIEELENCLDLIPVKNREIPKEALFLAGKAFLKYRRSDGVKSAPLPDFYIGAHAAVEGWSVITRDPKRMQYYYPGLDVISP